MSIRAKSSWSVGEKVTARKSRAGGYRCAYCGELGHNRQTCTSVEHVPVRIRDRMAALKQENHPMEWERLQVVREALEFIAQRQKDSQARAVARLALEAMSWGER